MTGQTQELNSIRKIVLAVVIAGFLLFASAVGFELNVVFGMLSSLIGVGAVLGSIAAESKRLGALSLLLTIAYPAFFYWALCTYGF